MHAPEQESFWAKFKCQYSLCEGYVKLQLKLICFREENIKQHAADALSLTKCLVLCSLQAKNIQIKGGSCVSSTHLILQWKVRIISKDSRALWTCFLAVWHIMPSYETYRVTHYILSFKSL